LRTKADWQKLYRQWVGVPQSERNRSGPTCINGIDVLENSDLGMSLGFNRLRLQQMTSRRLFAA